MASVSVAIAIPTSASAEAATPQTFHIPSQDLGKALMALARQSNREIYFSADLTRGKTAPAVRGKLTSDQALAQLLAGSGLSYRADSQGAITVQSAGGNGSAVGGPETAIAARGTIIGTVRDAKSGAALKGARVEVIATGATAATDDLGSFRLPNVPSGDVSIRVSYLGFPETTQTVRVEPRASAEASIILGGDTAEVVVVGQRSARAQALNQERTSENTSTIISDDLLGNFQGTTISEALRRAPGVAFEQDALTGDGTKVIVRGVTPDYNQVKLNGQALLVAGTTGRSASLNGVLADSVSEVRISKTLLANQDSSGTGGLVEIETKSPLDRPNNFVRLGAEFSKRAGDFGDDLLLTGTVSKQFGANENFGVSASVQFRRQSVLNYGYGASGAVGPYLPADSNGVPLALADIDPRRTYPFEPGVDDYYITSSTAAYTQSKNETKAITLSAAWDWSDHTDLRLDYTHSDRKGRSESGSAFTNSDSRYSLLPVPELNGANRYVLTTGANAGSRFSANSSDVRTSLDTLSLRGNSKFGRLGLTYQGGYNVSKTRTPFRYGAQLDGSFGLTSTSISPAAIDPRTGRVPSIFGSRTSGEFPVLLLTDEGFALIEPTLSTNVGEVSASYGDTAKSRSYDAELQAKVDVGDTLKYLDVGLSYKNSSFRAKTGDRDYIYGNWSQDESGNWIGPMAGTLGLEFFDASFGHVSGRGRSVQFLDPDSVADLIGRRDALTDAGLIYWFSEGPNALFNRTRTTETDLAAYAQARVDIGKLEIIGGLRLSKVTVDSVFGNGISFFDENGNFDEAYYTASQVMVSDSATQTDILPRVLANYRLNDDVVLRAGYFASVARPQIQLLTATQSIFVNLQPLGGPNGDRPTLSVSVGNPDLKPAYTENLDFSAEYYTDDVGAVKIGAFYKVLHNLLEANTVVGLDDLDGFQLPDDENFQNLPDDLFISVRKPVNNPKAGRIWGFEASIEKRLSFLPGVMDGLGVYANYTYTKSKKSAQRTWFTKPAVDSDGNPTRVQEDYIVKNVAFTGQPPHSGTVGLTYSRSGIDASILYSFQARRLNALGDFGLDTYTEANDTLDLRASYQFKLHGADLQVELEGVNLLKGAEDASVETTVGGSKGVPRFYTNGSFIGGRAVTAGLTVTF